MKLHAAMRQGSVVALMIVAALAASCSREPAAERPVSLPVVDAGVHVVSERIETRTENVMGTVRARLTAEVAAKVTGRVLEVLVAPGQSVAKGQELLRLDVAELSSELERARAMSEQARRDHERFSKLLAREAVTRQEFDDAQTRLRTAQATVEQARVMLSYATVSAPFGGVVTRKDVQVGDLATPGRPLVEIADLTELRLEADLPEALLAAVRIGQRYPISFEGLSDQLEGVVSEIEPASDPASRTARVKLDLPVSEGLRSGTFGRVAIPAGRRSVLSVPSAAVVKRGQLEFVYVLASNGRAGMRLVRSGGRADGEVEILSGLESGERVVVEGAAGLSDGQPVRASE